jgi:protein-disulfide isomerase
MLKKIKQNKYSIYIFITISLLALIIGVVLVLYFNYEENKKAMLSAVRKDQNKYPKINKTNQDPLITKVPSLSDYIKEPITDGNDPSWGNSSADIDIVYFSDFTCEYCYDQMETIRDISRQHQGKINLIWKDYPETDTDSLSWFLAKSGECAFEQGEFWSFYEHMKQKKHKVGQEEVSNWMNSADINKDLFVECLADQEVDGLIRDNILEAQALGITGIPFVFVGKYEIMGEADYDYLNQIIKEELKED